MRNGLWCVSIVDMSDTSWHTHLQYLVEYSRSQDVDVVFKRGCEDVYDTENHSIEINKRRTPKNQVYVLLHEIGHHKILKDNELQKKFASLTHIPRTLSKRILTLEEEVIAWHIGERVAQEHNIPLDSTYQVLKSKCLKTYVDSIASKKKRTTP